MLHSVRAWPGWCLRLASESSVGRRWRSPCSSSPGAPGSGGHGPSAGFGSRATGALGSTSQESGFRPTRARGRSDVSMTPSSIATPRQPVGDGSRCGTATTRSPAPPPTNPGRCVVPTSTCSTTSTTQQLGQPWRRPATPFSEGRALPSSVVPSSPDPVRPSPAMPAVRTLSRSPRSLKFDRLTPDRLTPDRMTPDRMKFGSRASHWWPRPSTERSSVDPVGRDPRCFKPSARLHR